MLGVVSTLVLLFAVAAASGSAAESHFYEVETPLDHYVQAPDPAFTYTLLEKEITAVYTRLTFNMTSQRWMSDAQVSRSLWFHTVHVIVPVEKRNTSLALLGLDDGNNQEPSVPLAVQPTLVNAAVLTGAVVIDVKQLPNEVRQRE
jgi:PhoPQ-activated pathogenicity-related protein